MDLDRFRDLAEAYGAERRRWPPAAHALFDRFAGTPEGAAILAEAERTDRFLDAWEAREPDAALSRAIAGAGSARSRRRRIWWQATAFAASAIIGFAVGFAQVRDDGSADLVTQFLLGPESVREIGL